MPALLLDPNSFSPYSIESPSLHTEVSQPPEHKYLAFDDSTEERAYWTFWMDNFYDSGTITLDIFWRAAATTGNVIWKAWMGGRAEAEQWNVDLTTGSQSVTDAAQGTTEYLNKATLTFTSPGISPSDLCILKFVRDADDGSDTMTGDAFLLYIILKYNVAG